MEVTLPGAVQPLIDAYLHALEPLDDHFYRVYIYGSIALGAFEEKQSDIDIVAITLGEWSPLELKQLAELHARLIKEHPLGRRLAVFYVPVGYLGCMHPRRNGEKIHFPVAHDGKFSPSSRGELNAVTWWIIKNSGIRLLRKAKSSLNRKRYCAGETDFPDAGYGYWMKRGAFAINFASHHCIAST